MDDPPTAAMRSARRVAAFGLGTLAALPVLAGILWLAVARVSWCDDAFCTPVGWRAGFVVAASVAGLAAIPAAAVMLLGDHLVALQAERERGSVPVRVRVPSDAQVAVESWASARDRSVHAPAGGEAGWYPDPWGAARFHRRRWDGTAWTTDTDPPNR